jgi:hypothetical protein
MSNKNAMNERIKRANRNAIMERNKEANKKEIERNKEMIDKNAIMERNKKLIDKQVDNSIKSLDKPVNKPVDKPPDQDIQVKFPKQSTIDPPILIISSAIFIGLAICYGIFKYIIYHWLIRPYTLSESINDTFPLFKNLILSKFILLILVFVVITLIILFFVYKLLLGGSSDNYSNVYGCIAVCFLTTVFITFILLEIFPYLVNIFENTLGYLWLCSLGYTSSMKMFNELFTEQSSGQLNDQSTDQSYHFLITVMSLFNMKTVLEDFKSQRHTFKLNDKSVDYDTISRLLFVKHSMGHFVWIYFASLVCTFTSIKAFSKYLN